MRMVVEAYPPATWSRGRPHRGARLRRPAWRAPSRSPIIPEASNSPRGPVADCGLWQGIQESVAMRGRRLSVLVASMMLGAFPAAGTARAAAYPLAGGGGSGLQFHLGDFLALPIQPKITVPFPTTMQLLVPPLGGATSPTGFVLQTAGPDPKDITIIYPVLGRAAKYTQLGVVKDHPPFFAVATNLSVQFPQNGGTAMFRLGTSMDPTAVGWGGRTGATTTTFTTPVAASKIRYSNALGRRFGGPGRFFVGNPGTKPAGALYAGVNATVWLNVNHAPGPPAPCVHPVFGGKVPTCVAILLQMVPNATATAAVWGAPVGATVTTPGGLPSALATVPGLTMTAKPKKGPEPGIMLVSANAAGSVLMSAFTAMAPTAMTGLTNMAASTGYPWTTGMLTIAAPAGPAFEIFMITGMDSRVNGVGAIQLASGRLSRRTITGPNANRAWLRLNIPEPSATLGTLGALGMLALCHALARGSRGASSGSLR